MIKELEAVFPKEEETSTGTVLNLPSGVTRELARQAIDALDLDPVLKDLGTILAQQIAYELESMALRPADYVSLPEMPQMLAARLAAELSSAPETFVEALLQQMKLRG